VLVNDLVEAVREGVYGAPLRASYLADAPAVLPGSSLRGALRSQAERIARTLATHEIPDWHSFSARCPVCSPVVADPNAPLASCDALLRDAGVDDDQLVTS
jgi:hypothetical protein